MNLNDILPEIELISNEELKEKTIKVIEEALERGKWNIEDFDKIPFTLLIENTDISLLKHTRGVINVAIQNAKVLKEFYGEDYVDMDIVISGAILHDIGKLLEYERDENGKVVKSQCGKFLRHPFSGAGLAFKHNLPDSVVHIIAMHAKEGNLSPRSREAIIIHYADFVNFETLRSTV